VQKFDPKKQRRLDLLMDKNNEGELTSAERSELVTLVRAAEKLMLENARALRIRAEKRKLAVRPSRAKAAA
jgi:hypothetical protein